MSMHNMSGGSFHRVVSRRTSSSNSHFPDVAATGLGQRSVTM
jgi:hypothetical protein